VSGSRTVYSSSAWSQNRKVLLGGKNQHLSVSTKGKLQVIVFMQGVWVKKATLKIPKDFRIAEGQGGGLDHYQVGFMTAMCPVLPPSRNTFPNWGIAR